MDTITWVKERKGHYTCDGWSVTHESDPDTINALTYVIRHQGKEQGRAQTLRHALVKAGLMLGNADQARLAAKAPIMTRQEFETNVTDHLARKLG